MAKRTGCVGQEWREALHPPEERHVVDHDASSATLTRRTGIRQCNSAVASKRSSQPERDAHRRPLVERDHASATRPSKHGSAVARPAPFTGGRSDERQLPSSPLQHPVFSQVFYNPALVGHGEKRSDLTVRDEFGTDFAISGTPVYVPSARHAAFAVTMTA